MGTYIFGITPNDFQNAAEHSGTNSDAYVWLLLNSPKSSLKASTSF